MLRCENCGGRIVLKAKHASQSEGCRILRVYITTHVRCEGCGQEMLLHGEGRTVFRMQKEKGDKKFKFGGF